MPTAFVLINTETDAEEELLRSLRQIEGVEEAYIVYGIYSIITKIKAESMAALKEIVTWRIRLQNKVASTLTMLVMEP